MKLPIDLFIDNEFKPAIQRSTQINPATDDSFAEVSIASIDDLNRAVESADKTFRQTWRDLAPGKRAEILFKIAAGIRANLETIAQWEMQAIGKPIADARDEIALGARIFEYYAGAIGKFFGHTIPVGRGGFDFTIRQPLGAVACIVPWNFPFPIACWKVAPALAAGNTVILKPATLSPCTALALGQIVAEAGLPAGALQVLTGPGGAFGDALVTHPLIRKISFTGSTVIGSRIMTLAARDIKRVSLELGGKSPNIIFADADLARAAETSPMSVFANTGQDCCARSRVFVEAKAYDQFVEAFLAATNKIKVGNPADDETQVGPMVSKKQRESVEEFIASARSANRQIIGATRPQDRGAYLSPTIILEPDLTDRVWREEIFGPVVCIRRFTDEQEMIAQVNASPYGLSGSLWTNNLPRALRVARQIESGVLSINSHSSVHVEAPFGGYKQSGLGRDLGMHSLEGFTELKNIYIAET
jgi:acyl-CoA reductase-like NAD-dependent aldehyde dehydrogenase